VAGRSLARRRRYECPELRVVVRIQGVRLRQSGRVVVKLGLKNNTRARQLVGVHVQVLNLLRVVVLVLVVGVQVAVVGFFVAAGPGVV